MLVKVKLYISYPVFGGFAISQFEAGLFKHRAFIAQSRVKLYLVITAFP